MFAVVAGGLCAASSARAFPIFARKYETSCATCHVAVPKLNNFGIAFKNNGYEWPGGEEDMVRDKPVVLAAEANRESFPKTLWPSWLPKTVPIGILMVNEFYVTKQHDPMMPSKITGSPEGFGTDIELGLGGAIASGIAARADLTLQYDTTSKSVDVGIEQAFMLFRIHKNYLDLKIGRMYPEIFSFPIQALGGDLWLNKRSVGATPWTLAGRPGLELRSIFARGRMRAVLGTAGSEGDLGNSFDGWARLGVKIGGLRLDGVQTGQDGQQEPTSSADPSKPWRDNSIQIGAFGYLGSQKFAGLAPADMSPATILQDKFYEVGGDLNVWLADLNLIVAVALSHHTQLTQDPTIGGKNVVLALAQADWVVYPWLIPTVRFEWSDDAKYLTYDQTAPRWHAMGGVSALIRANIRAYVFVEIAPDPSNSIDFSKATLGVFAAL